MMIDQYNETCSSVRGTSAIIFSKCLGHILSRLSAEVALFDYPGSVIDSIYVP